MDYLLSHDGFTEGPRVTLLEIGARRNFRWMQRSIKSFHWKYYWNPNGRGAVRVGEQRFSLRQDKALLISPGTQFEPDSPEPMDHFFLHFSYSGPSTRIFRMGVYEVDADSEKAAKVYDTVMLGEAIAFEAQLTCLSILFGALAELPRGAVEREVSDNRIAEWIQRIDLEPENAPSNEVYAASVGLHSQSAIRLFRQQTGMTPRQYVLQRRLEKACLLLAQRSLSQDQVANQSGFGERRYLWRMFMKHLGVSPVEYRKNLRNLEMLNLQTLLRTETE